VNESGIVAAAEEERFNRIKRSGKFPEGAIEYVLEEADLSPEDIDTVAIPRKPILDNKRLQPRHLNDLILASAGEALRLVNHTAVRISNHLDKPRTAISDEFREAFSEDIEDRITYVPHHRAHASSAFHCSGFDEQIGLTMDGSGEYESTVLWNASLERERTFSNENSMGLFYRVGTKYLGFRGSRDAGKVMGLASYGEYRDEFAAAFEEITSVDSGEYNVSAVVDGDVEFLEKHFGERRVYPEKITERHQDFAYHLQRRLEDIVLSLVRNHVSNTGCHNVSLAGGVGMNCKLNREIKNLDCVNNLFIQPAANDSGLSLGAALDVLADETTDDPEIQFNNVYFGPQYQIDSVESLLNRTKLEFERADDVERKTAQLLHDGYLVGWFQGRMEFGARALGNRSILANPSEEEYKDLVNLNVKDRENWRPFAPSLTHEAREEYLVNGDESPYMILLDEVKDQKQQEVPAVTHVDGTCRPQTVRREANPRYYDLLDEFGKLSGTPVLLNTSFNVAGEPIVESPEQAIRDFSSTGLDVLVLNEYIITKPTVDELF
jgi:carbamoyltransferase